MITLHDTPQGSPEWLAAREGKYTGTSAHKLLKFGVIEYSKTTDSGFQGNWYTRRGHYLEAEVIELYETIKRCKVPRPGYVTNSDFPDCLFSPDGLPDTHLIECKAFNEKKHLQLYYNDIPLEVMAQIQFGLMLCERPLAHLLIYNPDLEAKLAFKIIEIKYNPKIGNNFKRILSGVNYEHVHINTNDNGRGDSIGDRSHRSILPQPDQEKEK